jgi:hypothetical protein
MAMTDEQREARKVARKQAQALQVEADAQRHAAKTAEWTANGTWLSWEEYVAGVPCRGCGQPWVGKPASWVRKGTMHYTDQERVEAAEQDRLFKERHPDCRAVRLGSEVGVTHCGYCCPPPPLSPGQRDRIRELFSYRTPPEALNHWELTLTCGHLARATAHHTHETCQQSTVRCDECGGQIRAVVESRNLGRQVDPVARPTAPTPAARKRAEARVAKQRAALAEAEAALSALPPEA